MLKVLLGGSWVLAGASRRAGASRHENNVLASLLDKTRQNWQ